jgi:hypothetical protein
MPDNAPEVWSWAKFFSGFIDGRNYAKAIVLGVCMLVVVTVLFSVFTVVKARFSPKQATIQTVSGGEVDASVNKRVKNSILGLF